MAESPGPGPLCSSSSVSTCDSTPPRHCRCQRPLPLPGSRLRAVRRLRLATLTVASALSPGGTGRSPGVGAGTATERLRVGVPVRPRAQKPAQDRGPAGGGPAHGAGCPVRSRSRASVGPGARPFRTGTASGTRPPGRAHCGRTPSLRVGACALGHLRVSPRASRQLIELPASAHWQAAQASPHCSKRPSPPGPRASSPWKPAPITQNQL